MSRVAIVLLLLGVGTWAYTYFGYPLLLMLVGAIARRRAPQAQGGGWPRISISIPAYNEEASIAATLDQVLDIDYPADRRQIVVISDASSDRTDDIVRSYASRGVELLRMPERGGKTAAENAARPLLSGDIVVNTDASVRIRKDALKPLIGSFADASVGVASGRDVSVARVDDTANLGESGYVGYEMWVRSLETKVSGIVGASGCFYAIRRPLHMALVPVALSRDFAAALIAREPGFRAISVNEAVCFVPRTSSLRNEYRRKVRTMARGMETLWYKRNLLHPFRDPVLAWMLFSHKICRWLTPWLIGLGVAATTIFCLDHRWAQLLAAASGTILLLAGLGWVWPPERKMPRILAIPTFAVSGNIAALNAGLRAMRGELNPIWEPTRRKTVETT